MSGAPRITFEKLKPEFYPEHVGFRPGTHAFPIEMSFILMNGGGGDYMTWMQPIRWLASEATWINGTIIVPKYFRELAEYWLKDYPKWKFADYTDAAKMTALGGMPFRGPVDLQREALNATGAHLITCGWVYFTNKESAPDGIDPWYERHGLPPAGWDYYPPFLQSDLDALELPPEAKDLVPKKYAVITTGITTPSRKTPHGAWNPVVQHVIDRGLTPVFLGKTVVETGNSRNIHTTWEGTDYSKGLDLRDKTTLLQAASIMSRAAFVVGHDNGLLHLAGCTRDVPIILGYNLASPKHREPRRPVGKVYNVFLTKEELACTFCQSNCNFVIAFNFRQCFYGDTKCMSMLFEDGAIRWKNAIDQALKDAGESLAPLQKSTGTL